MEQEETAALGDDNEDTAAHIVQQPDAAAAELNAEEVSSCAGVLQHQTEIADAAVVPMQQKRGGGQPTWFAAAKR
jgi:hypothetical protein